MPHTKPKTVDFLSKLPLFSDLAPEDLDFLAERTREIKASRGDMLFQRGDPCTGFHTVVYGQVKLAFTSPGGAEKVVSIVGPGQSFGEALMFMEKPYIVYAQALTDAMLLHVAQSAVFEALERDRMFARRMLAGLSRRLHGLITDVEAYSLHSGTQRVIGYLLKDDAADGHTIELQVQKTVIASRLNLTPEHLSRILADLHARRLIEVDGKRITLLDIERLRDYEG